MNVTVEKQTLPQQAVQISASRSLLVDVVRGLAIALVALGHTDQGTEHRGWWGSSPVGHQLETFIYAFHMPAFFFISGIFLASSVAKRGPASFTRTKVAQMLYPYLLWSVLQYLLAFPLQRFINKVNPSPQTFLMDLLDGSTLWFLPAIFCCVVLGMLLRKVNKPLLFVVATLLSQSFIHWPIHFLERTFQHFPFLVAGMWISREYERLERLSMEMAALVAIVLGVLIFAVSSGPLITQRWMEVPVGLAGTGLLFLVARCCRKGSVARTLAWIGEASFGVYLLSAYGQGGGRELLLRVLHTTQPYVQLLVPTLLAVAIPAWIYQHRVRLRVGWLFEWPF